MYMQNDYTAIHMHMQEDTQALYLKVVADAFIISKIVLIPVNPEPIMILINKNILNSSRYYRGNRINHYIFIA